MQEHLAHTHTLYTLAYTAAHNTEKGDHYTKNGQHSKVTHNDCLSVHVQKWMTTIHYWHMGYTIDTV